MSRSPIQSTAFFEPWNLGDALIAAWAASRYSKEHSDQRVYLACASKYHEILRSVYPGMALIGVDLGYVKKSQGHRWRAELGALSPTPLEFDEVYSIRGDLRDYLAAGKIFPKAHRVFTGWWAFIARRATIFDLPFEFNFLRATSRYRRWCELVHLPYVGVVGQKNRWPDLSQPMRVVLHIGALWRNKCYPGFRELVRRLREEGFQVQCICGPGDPHDEALQVTVLQGAELVKWLRSNADLLISNDSGPMHLGFAMGLPTIALFGNTGTEEWAPPGVTALSGDVGSGYRPRFEYQVDETAESHSRWPSVDTVVQAVTSYLD